MREDVDAHALPTLWRGLIRAESCRVVLAIVPKTLRVWEARKRWPGQRYRTERPSCRRNEAAKRDKWTILSGGRGTLFCRSSCSGRRARGRSRATVVMQPDVVYPKQWDVSHGLDTDPSADAGDDADDEVDWQVGAFIREPEAGSLPVKLSYSSCRHRVCVVLWADMHNTLRVMNTIIYLPHHIVFAISNLL